MHSGDRGADSGAYSCTHTISRRHTNACSYKHAVPRPYTCAISISDPESDCDSNARADTDAHCVSHSDADGCPERGSDRIADCVAYSCSYVCSVVLTDRCSIYGADSTAHDFADGGAISCA